MSDATVPHSLTAHHSYTIHYPAHGPRRDDPHYVDFEHYRRLHKDTAVCYVGERIGFGNCTPDKPLELHHAFVEFSLTNGVSFEALEHDFPGISDPSQVGVWVESDQNFRFLCVFHHRGHAGAHVAAHADWEAQQYVPGLIS